MRTIDVTLPNGFQVITAAGPVQITTVTLRSLTGDDENLIRDRDELKKGGILDKLMRGAMVRLGHLEDPKAIEAAYPDLPLADLTFLLVELRKHAIGHRYTFEQTCPACRKIFRPTIDLNELTLEPQKTEYRFKDRIDGKLEDGLTFEFRPLRAKDTKALDMIKEQYPRERGTREIGLQVLSINGKASDARVLRQLELRQLNEIRLEIEKASGGLDVDLLMDCPRCESTIKEGMPIQVRDFFFRAADTSGTVTATPFLRSGPTQPSSPKGGDGPQETLGRCP